MKKYTFSQLSRAGFTLVELLVTTGVLGLVTMTLLSQVKLVNNSKVGSNSDAVVNSLRDKLIIELSKEKTCTMNFSGKPANALTTYTNIKDSENNNLVDLVTNYGKSVAGNSSSAGSVDLVQVSSISTNANPTNNDELILNVKFAKKSGVGSFFSSAVEIDIPLSIVKTASNVAYCFSDATLSIATTIRLSCQGNSSFYNTALNPPYGQCEHDVQPTLPVCPAGKFIKKVGINLSNQANNTTGSKAVEYECVALESTCPAGLIITNTNIDGTVTCSYPLPNCAPGQMMIMSAPGKYICLNSNIGCTGLNAVKSFNSDGSVTCAQFYPPQTCTGFVTNIAPGSISCSANVKSVTCPFGKFISSFDSTGQPLCSSWVNLPANCPAGQGATGIDSAGNLTCQVMDKLLSCNGSVSSNTFRQCIAGGGTVMNRYVQGSTDAYCVLNAATCPAGSTPCINRRYTVNNSCTDSNSACAYSVQSRTAPGAYYFGAYNPSTITCNYWARNSGPWIRSCTPMAQAPIYAITTQVGCY